MSSEAEQRPKFRNGIKRGPYSHLSRRAAYNVRMEQFALRHPAAAIVLMSSLLALLAYLLYLIFTLQ